MLEIDVDEIENKSALPVDTFLLYGATRSGKTSFMASMPRPVFFADASEKGWDSAIKLAPSKRFEADVKPIVWGITSQADVLPMIERVKPLIASKRVMTICFDSVSYYADLALNGITQAMSKYDARQAYGTLGNHLRDLRIKIHDLGVNVAWSALAKDPDEDTPLGGPMIPGQQGPKFAAGVGYLFYFRKEVPLNPIQAAKVGATYEVRTKQWYKYPAGSRLGDAADLLPDPFVGTYSDFIACLGYDPEALREALPPIAKTVVTAKPVTPTAKPVTPTAKPVARVITPVIKPITK